MSLIKGCTVLRSSGVMVYKGTITIYKLALCGDVYRVHIDYQYQDGTFGETIQFETKSLEDATRYYESRLGDQEAHYAIK